MTVDSITERFNSIEKSWPDATTDQQKNFLTELQGLADELERVSGETANRAEWLERRIRRLIRNASALLQT